MKPRPAWASAVLLCWLMHGFSLGGGRPVEIRDRQVYDLSGSPHRVTRDIIVEDSGEMVIQPGVELRFAPGVGIVVNGVLKAQGTAERPVMMTVISENEPGRDAHSDRDTGVEWPSVRLTDGSGPLRGRLQLRHGAHWWSVCTRSKNWTDEDVRVVCRHLGFSGGLLQGWLPRHNDSRQLMFASPNCIGNEQKLEQCPGWARRQLGSGICDFQLDIEVTCEPKLQEHATSYWRGLQFELAKTEPQGKQISPNVWINSEVSQSILEHVIMRYGGRQQDGNATAAIQVYGTPPVMRNIDVRLSAYHGINITMPNQPFEIQHSVFSENRGYGIFVNTSKGGVSLLGVKVMKNGADGIVYTRHETKIGSKNEFLSIFICAQHSLPSSFCLSVELKARHPNLVMTLHFKNMQRYDGRRRLEGGTVTVWNGDQKLDEHILARFNIDNTTVPQSVSSEKGGSLTVEFQPPKFTYSYLNEIFPQLQFSMEAVLDVGKDYDLNVTDCHISSNNGRGIWLRDGVAGASIVETVIQDNSHVAGIHIDGGVGDLVVNRSDISRNQGDGINVTYAGGYKHIQQSFINENSRRGIALWFNETSHWMPFNFTTHVSFSNISSNGDIGVLFGNVCRADAFWNVSMNTFGANGGAALVYQSCWMKTNVNSAGERDILLITHNRFGGATEFGGSHKLSIQMTPALNVNASIRHNTFMNHTSGVIWIENKDHGEYLEHHADKIAKVQITENDFKLNSGTFVARIGVVHGSSVQMLSFDHNRLEQNSIHQHFPRLNPRSRVAAVVVVTSNNTIIKRNRFVNPTSDYELGSHLDDHSSIINASLNYWGPDASTSVQIYNRIFDRKDRYNLATVQFLQYLLNGHDLDTEELISSEYERDKTMQFKFNSEIGGEVMGVVTLEKGRYTVKKDIFVRRGSKLRIKPGTTLHFEQSIGMMVQGELESDGTNDQIMYTGMPVPIATEEELEDAPMDVTSLRLSAVTEGTIEVTVNGTTGGVCAYGFTVEAAALVCQQLGMVLSPHDWLMEPASQASSGGTRDILLSNVRCSEMDTNFLACKHEVVGRDFENSCFSEVGIRCIRPSWAGIRLGVHAKSSTLKNVIIEKAGQLDYATHAFKPALQVDFNNHILEHLNVRENTGSGIGLMWNDIFRDIQNPVVRFSELRNNNRHGIITRSQGVDIADNMIQGNQGGGIWYDPVFTRQEQRDMVRWAEDAVIVISENIRLTPDERQYIRIAGTVPHTRREFQVSCEDKRAIGIMVVDPFREDSTETLLIRRGRDFEDTSAPMWDARKNLTSFPLRETGFIVTLRYETGSAPRGGAVLMMTAVQPLGSRRRTCTGYYCKDLGQAQWLEYKLNLNIERNTITSCGYGFGSNHYNRDIGPDEAFYYHRYSNETIHLSKNTIRDSQQYAIFISSPLWDPLTSSLAEIVYNLTGNQISNNQGGISHYSRDLRSSNNLFHWIINKTEFNNNHGGIDLRLPYVWDYNENYTHSVVLTNSTIKSNRNFKLRIDGHFARFNATWNTVENNECSPGDGVFTIAGMEKEMLIRENLFLNNKGKYVVEFNLESHSERFSVVSANFYYNILESNHPDASSGMTSDHYEPSSYTVSIRGVQRINITQNLLVNPAHEFEFLAGVFTSSLNNAVNVAENWWGSLNTSDIKSRVFDLDDWNGYAAADFSPYLARAEFNGPLLSYDEVNEWEYRMDTSRPLGGRLLTSLTLYQKNSPYIVKSDLTILPNVTLTILEGVEIQFYPSVGILVLGDLNAVGRPWSPIRMGPFKQQQSSFRYKRTLPRRSVRLCIDQACTTNRRDGFLEFFNATTLQWVPVCDQRFTERNAEVVCRELGFGILDVWTDRGYRHELGPTELSIINSWPHPLQCSGRESSFSTCELRLNGYGEHSYACTPYDRQFVYIHCGEELTTPEEDFWGGIRFSVPDYKAPAGINGGVYASSRYYTPPTSSLRHVHIRKAGILHNEKGPAVQVVLRDVTLEHLNISESASNGIDIIASPGYQYIHAVNITHNRGTGINFVTLNGQTSTADRLNYVPLGPVDIPYNIFGLVDICDNNKAFPVGGKVLLYYKYDNRPVECIKIFTSKSRLSQKVGFRILQFNLFNSTEFTPHPDSISIFDGDVFNSTVKRIGHISVGMESQDNMAQTTFYRSQGTTLSVKLHATGASGLNGFIAEVVTIPLQTITARDSKHNITASYFYKNRRGAVAYRSAGEITPILTLHGNRFEDNGDALFGNFSSSEAAVFFDIQNSMEMHILRNLFMHNQGGLRISVSSTNSVSALKGYVHNNLFTQNKNRESLYVRSGETGMYQYLHVYRNYFARESAAFRDNVVLEKVTFNFSENMIVESEGYRQMSVLGFEKTQSSGQLVYHNWLWDNEASAKELKATVLAESSGQKFSKNYFLNRLNYFEIITANNTEQENSSFVDAESNWWGFKDTSAVVGRIYDRSDQPELLEVRFQPHLEYNDTVISGNCMGGWEMIEDTCFLYIPGPMTHDEAKRFCQLDASSMPYLKQKLTKLMQYISDWQEGFDWFYERIWVQSLDIPLDQCAVLYRGSVWAHDCNDRLPFLCERAQEIVVRSDYWYQEPVSITAMSLLGVLLICVCIILGFWWCKSQERHKQHLQRQNSIRASIRSASNRSLDRDAFFSDYKHRIERALADTPTSTPPRLTVHPSKHNGSTDSVAKQYTYDLDDSRSYDDTVHEVRNPALDYSSDIEEKYPTTMPEARKGATDLQHPTFDLTYENRGYMDRSVGGYDDSLDASRDWSSGTDSTLDMKRSLETPQVVPMDPSDNTFKRPDQYPPSHYANTDNYYRRQPLETAM
nr:protein bark beetle-like [Rhipicephalus microplus]